MKQPRPILRGLKLSLIIAAAAGLSAQAEDFTYGKWSVHHDGDTKATQISKDGKLILDGVTPRFKNQGTMTSVGNYDNVSYNTSDIQDELGKARRVQITYTSTKADLPVVEQSFYLYDGKDYMLTDLALSKSGGGKVSTNYISPIYSETPSVFLPQDVNNRFITVPFDNDGFVEYCYFPFSCASIGSTGKETGRVARDSVSFEVTAFFNAQTEQGLVVGSVDHDTWKTGIRFTGSPLSQGAINKIECISGITHAATRDTNGSYLQPHGTVTGEKVKSARLMLHYSDDWCTGMETFGEVCAQISGKAKYDGPAPYGWNSWGGMERNVNYDGVISASDFIKNNLQDKGGFGDGVVYVGLDSFWDNLNWDQLKAYADHCYANGQVPGIYWTPWCDWLFSGSRAVEGNNGYYYDQGYLKVNGANKSVAGALCMDPTAPATISRLNYFIDKFKMCGFKYIKLDFLTNGIVEADSYYNPEITTGVQAYNYGMKKLRERCGDDMFIVESIAPLFPAQYANARRISCDAWGEMYHIGHMMNSYSFGWWLNRVYNFVDPDHLVMGNRSDAENISRMTTGAITGYFMLGDNLSTKGSYVGNKQAQDKAVKYATVADVNEVVKLKGGFRPAGGKNIMRYRDQYGGYHDEINLFYKEEPDCYYVAFFNYSQGNNSNEQIDLTAIGINPTDLDISKSKECWTGQGVNITDGKIVFNNENDKARLWKLCKK